MDAILASIHALSAPGECDKLHTQVTVPLAAPLRHSPRPRAPSHVGRERGGRGPLHPCARRAALRSLPSASPEHAICPGPDPPCPAPFLTGPTQPNPTQPLARSQLKGTAESEVLRNEAMNRTLLQHIAAALNLQQHSLGVLHLLVVQVSGVRVVGRATADAMGKGRPLSAKCAAIRARLGRAGVPSPQSARSRPSSHPRLPSATCITPRAAPRAAPGELAQRTGPRTVLCRLQHLPADL